LATQDSKLLIETSHALKGAIGNFTEKSAYLAAFELEKIGEHNDFSQAEAVINTLDAEVQKLEEALRTLAKGGSIL
jgi:HPt (histidine-containing phosphotransfer) domain-containing protein